MNEINYIFSNRIIRDFLKNDALEKVASDIRAKAGSGGKASHRKVQRLTTNPAPQRSI